MNGSKARSIVPTLLGALALAAALALSWPGVRVARADGPDSGDFERFMKFVGESPPPAAPAAGTTCQAATGFQGTQERLAEAMAAVKRHAREVRERERAAGAPPPPGVRVLNTRGYNYGAAPDAAAELGRIQREMERRGTPPS